MFVGKDVATALGYSNTSKAIQQHVDHEDKGILPIRETAYETRAVVWVTSEVLPSIRKTGRYELPQQLPALALLNEDAENTLTATQVAKTFNMTVFDFNAVLRDMGIQECGLEGFDWFAMLRGWIMARG